MQTELMLRSLQKLFPEGSIWENRYNNNSDFKKSLEGIAQEFARAKERGDSIITNLFPDTTELIDEWEHVFGLSDPTLLTEAQRRARLTGAWRTLFTGTMQSANMEALFSLNGINVTVRPLGENEDPRDYIPEPGQNNYLLVNGDIFETIQTTKSQFGFNQFGTTQFGEVGEYERIEKTYTIPDDTRYWGMIYFIEGPDVAATFGPIGTSTGGVIATSTSGLVYTGYGRAQIPAELETTFFDLAYQFKPRQMWAIARVDFV